MIEKTIMVSSSLEARPAALFVQTASRFESSIQIRIENRTVNAKSIMGVISMGILDGQELTIIASGNDENVAVDELSSFLTA